MPRQPRHQGDRVITPAYQALMTEYSMPHIVDLLEMCPSGVDRLFAMSQGQRTERLKGNHNRRNKAETTT